MTPPEHDTTSIGNVLVDLGFCTIDDVRRAAAAKTSSMRLGETLVALDIITAAELEWALVYQRSMRNGNHSKDVEAFASQQRAKLTADMAAARAGIMLLVRKIKAR